jgi:hypothetical protein
VLNVLNNTTLMRRLQLALYGFGALAALVMAVVSVPDARLPWFIVALFSAGSLIDGLREGKSIR